MDLLFSLKPSSLLDVGLVLLVVGYGLVTAFQRLFLSPIRHFPGSKLAALTRWYEFYYKVVLKGPYTFQIQKLHKQYGPIIRVTPNEIHVG